MPSVKSDTNTTDNEILHASGNVEAKINAKLSVKYALPFTVEIPLLADIATELTIFRLLTGYFAAGSLKDSPWPKVYKEAEECLAKVVSGEIPLLGTDGALISQSNTAAPVLSNASDYYPTMSELDGTESGIDPDLVDDLRADRDLGVL
jgi:phage gp36-like protein